MHRLGVQTKGLVGENSIDSGLELIAEAGFDCVDLNLDAFLTNRELYGGKANGFFDKSLSELEEIFGRIQNAMDRLGLFPSQMHAPYPVRVQGREEQNQYMRNQVIPKCLHIAAFLGVPFVVIHPWKLQYSASVEEEMEANRGYFSSLIPLAEEYRRIICLENLYEGFGNRLVEGVCGDIRRSVKLIEALNKEAGKERFGFCLDTGHLNIVRRDPEEAIRLLGNHLKILHLHDNDGWGDLHQFPYSFCAGGGPGRGVDWAGVLRGLRAVGYEGVLSFETSPCLRSFPEALMPDVLRAIERTGRYFASVLENGTDGEDWGGFSNGPGSRTGGEKT